MENKTRPAGYPAGYRRGALDLRGPGRHQARMRTAFPLALLALAACGAPGPEAPADALTLTVTGSETGPDGRICAFDVLVLNATGSDVANVQAAYMARTRASGSVSEYIVLGDFLHGEERSGRIFVTGAPCGDVDSLELVRAVCTVAPVADPAQSCAGAVWLDGGGVVEVVYDQE